VIPDFLLVLHLLFDLESQAVPVVPQDQLVPEVRIVLEHYQLVPEDQLLLAVPGSLVDRLVLASLHYPEILLIQGDQKVLEDQDFLLALVVLLVPADHCFLETQKILHPLVVQAPLLVRLYRVVLGLLHSQEGQLVPRVLDHLGALEHR
jgi:hypothetical protein